MRPKVAVPTEMVRKVRNFVKAEHIALEVTTEVDCALRIVKAVKGRKCDATTLYCDGWINCPTALLLAKKHSIPPRMASLWYRKASAKCSEANQQP